MLQMLSAIGLLSVSGAQVSNTQTFAIYCQPRPGLSCSHRLAHVPAAHATAPVTVLPFLMRRYPGFARLQSEAWDDVAVAVVRPGLQGVHATAKSTLAFQAPKPQGTACSSLYR
jgi:hypothetical protein